jgi:hypothetical protein
MVASKSNEISDVIQKFEEFLAGLSPKNMVLMNICRELHDGNYDRMIGTYKSVYAAIDKTSERAEEIRNDLGRLNYLKKLEDCLKKIRTDDSGSRKKLDYQITA